MTVKGFLGMLAISLLERPTKYLLKRTNQATAFQKTTPGGIVGQQWFQHFATDDHVDTTRAFSTFTVILR